MIQADLSKVFPVEHLKKMLSESYTYSVMREQDKEKIEEAIRNRDIDFLTFVYRLLGEERVNDKQIGSDLMKNNETVMDDFSIACTAADKKFDQMDYEEREKTMLAEARAADALLNKKI